MPAGPPQTRVVSLPVWRPEVFGVHRKNFIAKNADIPPSYASRRIKPREKNKS